jgi:hypothetical protein
MPSLSNYCFTWGSVVINVIFYICFGIIICYTGKFYFEDFLNCHFELLEENYMKIFTAGQIIFFKLGIVKVFEIYR